MPREPHFVLPEPLFDEPTFNETIATKDPSKFKQPHPSDEATYKKIQELLTKDTVTFDPSRLADDGVYSLAQAWGSRGDAVVKSIRASGQIVFHSFGDSGAAAARNYSSELHVSDAVTHDFHTSAGAAQPSFLFHLGDVVYNFGESKYYYDQFYEPYRNYPAPIFAIPGNHDSFIVPGTADADDPLVIFARNFCSLEPVITPEAGSLHRTAMTQPGVYYTLDAPFVRIIGLFSNSLEDPGLISSENGKWAKVPDVQLAFLETQLNSIKAQNYTGAVILATHHPPFVYAPPPGTGSGSGGYHGSSTDMLRDIDAICQKVGVYPHVHFSGHAHNYQRYTRSIDFAGATYEVPYVVCGSGGHAINPIVTASGGNPGQEPANGTDVSYLEVNPAVAAKRLVLESHNDQNFGYLRVKATAAQLEVTFYTIASASQSGKMTDRVTIDLATHKLAANSTARR